MYSYSSLGFNHVCPHRYSYTWNHASTQHAQHSTAVERRIHCIYCMACHLGNISCWQFMKIRGGVRSLLYSLGETTHTHTLPYRKHDDRVLLDTGAVLGNSPASASASASIHPLALQIRSTNIVSRHKGSQAVEQKRNGVSYLVPSFCLQGC